jgi:uncharacterized RDD family membrane protein YckC
MSEAINPFAPPTAEVADITAAGTQALAGRGARLGAALIDGIVQAMVFGLVAWLLGWNLFKADQSFGGFVRLVFAGLAVFALLQGWLLVKRGQTIGKRLLGMRIVRPDGSAVGAARLIGLRYALGYVLALIPVLGPIYGLIDSLLIFRESRRCLHDQIADTIVVKV